MDDLKKKSPPGRKEEVEELKAKGLPASEAFGIAWKQHNEHGKPKVEKADIKAGARVTGPQGAAPATPPPAPASTPVAKEEMQPKPKLPRGRDAKAQATKLPHVRQSVGNLMDTMMQKPAKPKLPRKFGMSDVGMGAVAGELAMSEKPLSKAVPATRPSLPRKAAPPPAPTPESPNAPKGPAQTPNLFAGKYPLADASHHDEVATNASINMLKMGMPREQAEEKAHKDYVTKLRTDALHYHAAGMKAASAIGDNESAKKHAGMFQLHRTALGENPVGAAPARMAGQPVAPKMRFKPHPGDHFAVNSDIVSSAPHPSVKV